MNNVQLVLGGVIGILFIAFAFNSMWLRSLYGYFATVVTQTVWFIWFAYIVVSNIETDTAIVVAVVAAVLSVYSLLLYMVTYKFILKEPFLHTVRPEKLKAYVLDREGVEL